MKVKHIVLMKFKHHCPSQQIANCFAELAGLTQQLEGIEHFSCGEYSSPENLNRGFTHAFEMIFKDEKARDNYLIAPAHVKVANQLIALVDKENNELQLVAFDYLLS